MEKEVVKDNSLKTLRKFMFDEMVKIRSGNADITESNAIAKLAGRVIETYKTEIEAVKVANDLKDKNFKYVDSITAISHNGDGDV